MDPPADYDPQHTIRDVVLNLEEELKKEEHSENFVYLAKMIDAYLLEMNTNVVDAKDEEETPKIPISWDVGVLRKQVKYFQELCPDVDATLKEFKADYTIDTDKDFIDIFNNRYSFI